MQSRVKSKIFTSLLLLAWLTMLCKASMFYSLQYTGIVQNFTIPNGVYVIMVDLVGATGGDSGQIYGNPGSGGRTLASVTVTPGQVVYVFVGGKGNYQSGASGYISGGWNGGGRGYRGGTSGGGATDIRIGGQALTNRVVIAGGGGGYNIYCAQYGNLYGGNGGSLGGNGNYLTNGGYPGGSGCSNSNIAATGGTQTSGGSVETNDGGPSPTTGSLGYGGDGGNQEGGGGGGGYYGGGGSSRGSAGGGSSYVSSLCFNATLTSGYNGKGNGWATIWTTNTPTSQPSTSPTDQPSGQPSRQPTMQPSSRPTRQPTTQPSANPTQPTAQPSRQPSLQPTMQPSVHPSMQPSDRPTPQPTSRPSLHPSVQPTLQPSSRPTYQSTSHPTCQPTLRPTVQPSIHPTNRPSGQPSGRPTDQPTSRPTLQPTGRPSSQPSKRPSFQPTCQPSDQPSRAPSANPSRHPSMQPSSQPSRSPSRIPSSKPSAQPTCNPLTHPTAQPSGQPLSKPTSQPTGQPMSGPSSQPSRHPTSKPSLQPSAIPSSRPWSTPTMQPVVIHGTQKPTPQPVTARPSILPTSTPSKQPFAEPSGKPSGLPTQPPSTQPSEMPSKGSMSRPSAMPSNKPSAQPVAHPTSNPPTKPSVVPSTQPSSVPRASPSAQPSSRPSSHPSAQPSEVPSGCPSMQPSAVPSALPSHQPITAPSTEPTMQPSGRPSRLPTTLPSLMPVSFPTGLPSTYPSFWPTSIPSISPSNGPSRCPISTPTAMPSHGPSGKPSTKPLSMPSRHPSARPTTLYPTGRPSHKPVIHHVEVTHRPVVVIQSTSPSVTPSIDPTVRPSVTPTVFVWRRTVHVTFSTSVFYPNQDYVNVLTVAMDTAPPVSVVLVCSLINSQGEVVSNGLVPDIINLSPQQSTVTLSLVRQSNPGVFNITITVQDPSLYGYVHFMSSTQSNYTVGFGETSFTILPLDIPPPAPALQSAIFNSDGSAMMVSFSTATDYGGLTLSFQCPALLSFPCNSAAKCVWSDAKTITISHLTCVVPGNRLVLSQTAAEIRAQCIKTSGCNTANWPTAANSSVNIAVPATATIPTVILNLPSAISVCSGLTLDLSSSYGNGGRGWYNHTIIVEAVNNTLPAKNISALQTLFNSYGFQGPLQIAPTYFVGGHQYRFIATLCNFLGGCGVASKIVNVVDDEIPIVTILGSGTVVMKRSQSLSVATNVLLSSCGVVSSALSVAVIYSWLVLDNGHVNGTLSKASIARNPSTFILSPYALALSHTYAVMVTATALDKSSSAEVTASLVHGNIYAVVTGGLSRNVRVNENLQLDGSLSYDEDKSGVTGSAAGLVYAWSCTQLQPSLNSSCVGVINSQRFRSTQQATMLSLLVSGNGVGHVLQVTMTVSDAANASRVASTIVQVTILPPLAPTTISLTTNALAGGVINPSTNLIVSGIVNFPTALSGNITWTVENSLGLNLDSVTMSPSVQKFADVDSSSLPFYLVLQANVLVPGLTYTFHFVANVRPPGVSSSAFVSVMVNTPPIPGSFQVQPDSGIALVTPFSFTCANWQDDNLPLTYQFAYETLTNTVLLLQTQSPLAFGSLLLTAGSNTNNYSVVAVAQIFDAYGANTTSQSIVRVSPPPKKGNLVDVTSSLKAINTTNVNTIKQYTAIASFLLNSANCSHAPDCVALNRLPCYSVDHTCGACVSSDFIGRPGNDNSVCQSLTAKTNTSTVDYTPLLCPGNCTGHGKCQYKSYVTGAVISTCWASSLDCYGECLCEPEYNGNSACSISAQELQSKQDSRLALISSLSKLSAIQEPTDQNMQYLANSLYEASLSPYELNQDAVTTLLSTSAGILNACSTAGVSVNAISNVANVIDSSATAMVQQGNMNAATSIAGLVANYSSLLAVNMKPAQYPQTLVQNNYRLRAAAYGTTETKCGDNVAASVPLTALEQAIGVQATSAMVPSCPASNTSSWSLSMVSTSRALLSSVNNAESNVLSLQASTNPCNSSHNNCSVVLVLQHSGSYHDSEYIDTTTFRTTCSYGDRRSHTHTCPSGYNITVHCNGTATKVISHCPNISYATTCAALSHSYGACEVLHHTPTNITCKCSLIPKGHRRLSNASEEITKVDVSYVSLLEATASNFESTVMFASSLNGQTVEKGWTALATVGALALAIVVALMAGHYADKREENTKNSKVSSLSPKNSAYDINMLELADQALPSIVHSGDMLSKAKEEMKHHHRYFAVAFHYSKRFPRVLRVLSLSSSIVSMLFCQALFYSFTHNGSAQACAQFTTESTCLSARNAYGADQAQCYWSGSSSTDGQCDYLPPDRSLNVIVFVAIFSALVSAPIMLLCDWLLKHVLAAPLLPKTSSRHRTVLPVISSSPLAVGHSRSLPIVPGMAKAWLARTRQRTALGLDNRRRAAEMFKQLCVDLKRYYVQLTNETDKEEFRLIWCLNLEGDFQEAKNSQGLRRWCARLIGQTENTEDVAHNILLELEELLKAESDERQRLSTLSSEREQSQRLLYLFQRDLLPGLQGLLLDGKNRREDNVVSPVSYTYKVMAWVFLGLLNASMLFYVLLFSIQQSSHLQAAWARTFAIWLIMEICLVSSCVVIVFNLLLPAMLLSDVQSVRRKLREAVTTYYTSLSSHNDDSEEERVQPFNAASYLFLSHRLATEFSSLKVAKMITQFVTVWPRQSYQHTRQDNSVKYQNNKLSAVTRSLSMVIIFLLSNLVSMPVSVQDHGLRLLLVPMAGYVVLGHYQLYGIDPVFVILPTIGLIVMGVGYWLWRRRKGAKRDVLPIADTKTRDLIAIVLPTTATPLVEKNSPPPTPKPVPNADTMHANRRQSVQAGLQLVHRLQHVLPPSSDSSNSRESEDASENANIGGAEREGSSEQSVNLHLDSSDSDEDSSSHSSSSTLHLSNPSISAESSRSSSRSGGGSNASFPLMASDDSHKS